VLFVLKLGFIIHHRIHFTASEVEIKFEVVLGPKELNGLDSSFHVHLEQAVVYEIKIADLERLGLPVCDVSDCEFGVPLFNFPILVRLFAFT